MQKAEAEWERGERGVVPVRTGAGVWLFMWENGSG